MPKNTFSFNVTGRKLFATEKIAVSAFMDKYVVDAIQNTKGAQATRSLAGSTTKVAVKLSKAPLAKRAFAGTTPGPAAKRGKALVVNKAAASAVLGVAPKRAKALAATPLKPKRAAAKAPT